MPRAKGGFKTRRRRNRILKHAKGFRGDRNHNWKVALEAVRHAWRYMFYGRKNRKRDFRRLWIVRINAAVREHGLSYSKLVGGLGRAGIQIDRKILADLAISDPTAFGKIVEAAKAAA
jgi:large subunit ribosomal protein L20